MKYKLSDYIAFTGIINEGDEQSSHKRIIYSTRTSANIVLNENVFRKIKLHPNEVFEEKLKAKLIEAEILVPEDENEFETVINQNEQNNVNTLGILVHTTANCQFGCSYCGQQHTKKDIDENIKNKIYEYVEDKLKTGNLKFLNVTWHGAEPLMSISNLRKMSERMIEIAAKYNVGYLSKIITNGLSLKRELYNELYHDLKISYYQITVDGSKEFHDKRRMLKNGGPTFDIIMKNILDITSQDSYEKEIKPIVLRINIDKTNSKGVFELIDIFAENNLQDKIDVHFYPVENYGDNKFNDQNGFAKKDFAEYEMELLLYTLQKGFKIGNILPERKYDPCMAVIKDHVAFDIYGNVFPCYDFLYTKHELEKENKIGNLLSGENTFNQDVPLRNWFGVIKSEKNACYSCNYLPVCGGYCPLKWFEGEVPCPSYKYNMEDRLVLNYLYNKANVQELLNQTF